MHSDPADSIRILIVDDHEVVREGLCSFLRSEPDLQVAGEASNGHEAILLYRELRPDIVIMDLRLPGMSGIEATKAIVALNPRAKIIVITTYEGEGHIHGALSAGVWAYLVKDAVREEIVSAIRKVHGGGRVLAPSVASTLAASIPRLQLTAREHDVLKLMAKGLRNREIGQVLGTTEGTVKMQVKAVLVKLEVSDRTEAVSLAMQRGLIDW